MSQLSKGSPSLERIRNLSQHTFEVPSKKINDGDDLSFFFASTAYRDITKWLLQLTRAVFPDKQEDGSTTTVELGKDVALSTHVSAVKGLLHSLSSLLDQAPSDTGPRRFGNVAFRKWYQLAEDSAADLLSSHLSPILPDIKENEPLRDELKAYLLGSFGSAQRLDYGTGHELSFLAFTGCLWKLGLFAHGEEQAIVTDIIQPYLELMRRLILTYTLEPAGSHGVWGLDDHSFVPYVLGAAQLGPAFRHSDDSIPIPTEGSIAAAPSASSVTDKAVVSQMKDSNMYFSAIQFIYDVKKGPFWEHSPVLYDISGIKDGWGKINKGMLKMYAAEVLGKFPVVQHFPFGSIFEWKTDPEAKETAATMHVQQQPTAMRSKDVPPAPSVGTTATWARSSGGSVPQLQSSTGVPSVRTPRGPSTTSNTTFNASTTATTAPCSMGPPGSTRRPHVSETSASTAPSVNARPSTQQDVPFTRAPWAKDQP